MDERLDAVLKRIGVGMTHYADEIKLRNHIANLEWRIVDAEALYGEQWARAQELESRLDALRATITGPGKAAYIVFVPDDGTESSTHGTT